MKINLGVEVEPLKIDVDDVEVLRVGVSEMRACELRIRM